MKVSEYRIQLSSLEQKVTELTSVHDQYAYGYAKTVLADARSKVQSELTELLNMELTPVAQIVNFYTSEDEATLTVGGTYQISTVARMTDGSIRDITAGRKVSVTYRDADGTYNNKGNIVAVDTSGYLSAKSDLFMLRKMISGWRAYSHEVFDPDVLPVDGQPNTFEITDRGGTPVGVRFKTDGADAASDNWQLEVTVEDSGTTYKVADPTVAAVTANGVVTGLAPGTTRIEIKNNQISWFFMVTVS